MTSPLEGSKLSYFQLSGRAEAARLVLGHAGINFTDERIEFKDWPALKGTCPFGSLPVLELADGTRLCQSRAILRFIGKHTGLYPTDALAACKVDIIMDALEDINSKVNNVGKGLETAEKEKARKEAALNGEIKAAVAQLEAFLSTTSENGYAVGSELTIADFYVFAATCFMTCGFYDGVPPETLAPFEKINAIIKTVAKVPSVQKFYDAPENSDPLRAVNKAALL